MSRRTAWPALAVAAAALTTVATVSTAAGSEIPHPSTVAAQVTAKTSPGGPPGAHAGPPYQFKTELMSYAPNLGLKDQMMLTRTVLGYRLWSGSQSSHLTITIVGNKLSFRDTGTQRYKRLTAHCDRQRVKVGIWALCRIPKDITASHPLLIEVWPRLGNDYTDSSTLPDTFALTMLADEGNDVAKFGAGPDFFNGHLGHDRVWGGGGNDWIRGGGGNDTIYGGPGNDDIVGMEANDTVYGGPGNDRIWTGPGDDDLVGDDGVDRLNCGTGVDTATPDSSDWVSRNCNKLN